MIFYFINSSCLVLSARLSPKVLQILYLQDFYYIAHVLKCYQVRVNVKFRLKCQTVVNAKSPAEAALYKIYFKVKSCDLEDCRGLHLEGFPFVKMRKGSCQGL